MIKQGYTSHSVSAGSVSAYAFNAASLSKVCVSPLRRTKAMKSPRLLKSSDTGTFKADAIFSIVSNEGFCLPVAMPLIDGWEMPIFSARALSVIPFSLQISLILNVSIIIKHWFALKSNANIRFYFAIPY